MPLEMKNNLISQLMLDIHEHDEYETEFKMNPFILEIDIIPAIRLI